MSTMRRLHIARSAVVSGIGVGMLSLLLTSPASAVDDDGGVSIGHWGNNLLITAPTGSEDVKLGKRMKEHVTVDFNDTPISDVVDFLRKVTSTNIVCDPAVTAAGTTVTLKAKDMELGSVLHWVVSLSKINMGFVDGAIYLSEKPYQGATKTVMYDVSDMVMPIHDFPGPEVAFNAGGQSGVLFTPAAAEQDTRTTTVEELEDILRKHLAKQSSH